MKDYKAEKTRLFILVSEKLGRGASPPTATEIVRRANQNAVVYFVAHVWRHYSSQQYFPILFVALVAIFLSGAAPAIFDGLDECQKSGWIVIGTVTAILCDIFEAAAIECTIVFNANTVWELLCQAILPLTRIAKFAGKVFKVEGDMSVQAAAEVAGEAVLMDCRVVAVVHSQPTWDVVAGRSCSEVSTENWLSAEEELIAVGLVLEQHAHGA